jgi:D-alanyl-D-alanine dipeptidase
MKDPVIKRIVCKALARIHRAGKSICAAAFTLCLIVNCVTPFVVSARTSSGALNQPNTRTDYSAAIELLERFITHEMADKDRTLYDLKTGQPVEMDGTYDETTDRSYPDYPGGTSLQRWHRELLRSAMEAEKFKVYEAEWWHFDYDDWRKYPIGNETFEKLMSDSQR